MPRARRASGNARWNPVFFGQIFVVNLVYAERAFLHHAFILVKLARSVRTGPRTQLTADARISVDKDDTVFRAFVGSARRAHGDAGRLFAMQARARKVNRTALLSEACFKRMNAIKPYAIRLFPIGHEIGKGRGMTTRVPFLAINRAGMAADTDVKIDDESQLLLTWRWLRQASHVLHPFPGTLRSAELRAAWAVPVRRAQKTRVTFAPALLGALFQSELLGHTKPLDR